MILLSLRIITKDVDRLIKIDEAVTGMTLTKYAGDFAGLHTGSATPAIGSARTLRFFGGEGVAAAEQHRTAIIREQV